MRRLNIRWRLTIWNTAALAVLLIAVGSIVFVVLRHALYTQLDRVLTAQYREIQNDQRMAEDHEGRFRHWIEEFYDHVGVYGVIYDADGNLFARTREMAAQSIPTPPAVSDQPYFDSRELPVIGQQRTMASSFDAAGRRFVVMLMLPLEDTLRELRQVATVLMTVLPFSLALAGALGYLLARKALAPVDQLRRATDEITAERLSQRLDIPNPDDELGRLGRTINAMLARLERSFAEIRRFTADASHELRTPISVIRTEAEVAMKKPPDAEQYQSLAGSILEECDHLTKLTDQLLTLSREDAGLTHVESTRLDLASLATEAVTTMRPLAETKGQTLTIDAAECVPVLGDAARLRQAIYNLLDNAIKYTPNGGRIEVEVLRRTDSTLLVVRDTGIGIPEEHLPRVLERFYRVDKARSREAGGTGLGLSIVECIVAAHGGRISITTDPSKKGTTCTIVLPSASRASST